MEPSVSLLHLTLMYVVSSSWSLVPLYSGQTLDPGQATSFELNPVFCAHLKEWNDDDKRSCHIGPAPAKRGPQLKSRHVQHINYE